MDATPDRGSVLLVEDDPRMAEILTDALAESGYRTRLAVDGACAREMARAERPDLVVLDIMLPDVDGLVLCSALREIADVPIVVCSATTRTRDAVLALKLGADSFIAKPFDLDEFRARIAAILRRAPPKPEGQDQASTRPGDDRLEAGALLIDRRRRRVSVGGAPIAVTPSEYRLLCALAENPDQVASREELTRALAGDQVVIPGRTVDTHLQRLRSKFLDAGATTPRILAVRGFGYRLATDTLGDA